MLKKVLKASALYPLIITEIVVGTLIAALAFYLFADMSGDVLASETLAMDHIVSHMIYALRTPFLTDIMFCITFLGGSHMLLVSTVLLVLYFIVRKHNRELLLFTFTFGIGVLLNLFIKYIVGRARPDMAPLIQEVFFSYPSGHSMNAFVFYGLLAYFVFHFSRNMTLNIIIGMFLLILILLIGVSRVYLGVHYPSDVLAGFFAGAAWLATVLVIDRTLRFYHAYAKKKH